jgi:hypothetical protein
MQSVLNYFVNIIFLFLGFSSNTQNILSPKQILCIMIQESCKFLELTSFIANVSISFFTDVCSGPVCFPSSKCCLWRCSSWRHVPQAKPVHFVRTSVAAVLMMNYVLHVRRQWKLPLIYLLLFYAYLSHPSRRERGGDWKQMNTALYHTPKNTIFTSTFISETCTLQ